MEKWPGANKARKKQSMIGDKKIGARNKKK
jgi:hypothetical protein